MPRFCVSLVALVGVVSSSFAQQPLPGTKPLEMKGDLARVMLEGIDRFLDKQIAKLPETRKQYWKPDFSSPKAYVASVESNRERFKKIIGVVGRAEVRTHPAVVELEYVGGTGTPSLVAETDTHTVHAVRWPVLPGVWGEGLLLEPKGKVRAQVVALPDADQTPEMIAGVSAEPSYLVNEQFARALAEQGCRVLVPTLINRDATYSGSDAAKRYTNQPHREFIYRMAYEMGRHVIGYEVQKVLAAVDWFSQTKDAPPIGVCGYGEGGLIAFYSGACDPRIQAVGVSGYFGPREKLHEEPIYRNVWGLLREFGDAEIAALVAPRALVVEWVPGPKVKGPPEPGKGRSGGAAPGFLGLNGFADGPNLEFARARTLSYAPLKLDKDESRLAFNSNLMAGTPGSRDWRENFLRALALPVIDRMKSPKSTADQRKSFAPGPRQKRQFDQLVDYTQKLLPASKHEREKFFWSKLDTSSVDKFKKSQEPLREHFWQELMGKLPEPNVPMNPRTRLIYETPKWKGYEVVLDVFEDVISYGILLVPNDIKKGEKRPCVVCQHGLEGRPTDVCDPTKKTAYYNSFGAQLADQGFVVFAPQNPYIFKNDFRQVVRKANPLQLTLYAFIIRQHQRILQFLGSLDFVDATRIAYYGLSYGGKVATRIPAILLDYCLSICSGDFNEWIWKNITLEWPGSYMFTGEYEMYEFDLGNTFNYAEMAALIAPRPFMVERGHSDGVGLDEYVAFEYAKVRRLYAKLGIADRTEIEFFTGGHEIRLVGTLAFLRKHLNWPEKGK